MQKGTLEQRIYLSQILGISLAILISLGISLDYNLSNKQESLDQNIGNTALLLSESSEVYDLLTSRISPEDFGAKLDVIVQHLDYIDVVSICDKNSIRYYHHDKEKIGGIFSGNDEAPILQGASPYVTFGEGTMGKQRRAFYPVKNADQEIIGFVMAAVLTSSISQLRSSILKTFLLVALLLLSVGIFLSHLLYLHLKTILLGYRPEDFRKIHIEEKEVMDALEEGILAINTEGEIILINESARKLLAFDSMPSPKTKLTDIYPETILPQIIQKAAPEYNDDLQIHGNYVLSNHIPIMKQGTPIGAISIFRNKTEVTRLAEELTGTHYMIDTLRAFNHEFKNKLHVILGYLEIGELEKIRELILHTSLASANMVEDVTHKILVPGIAALLIGKIIRASELNIRLSLKSDCICTEEPENLPVEACSTILGNLIENAIEELNGHDSPLKEIEVGIYFWKTGCILSVDDTGRGISEEVRQRMFEQGFSTKGENRGLGMGIIQNILRRYHGEIEIETEEQIGTCFTVTFSQEK